MSMKKAISLVVLFAFAFSAAWAEPVTIQEAKTAARAWVARGGTLGASLGLQVARVSPLALATSSTTTHVYCVSMKGGGTLFLSSDTMLDPVVAFTSATNDFSTLDARSPLFALLTRDADARANKSAPRTNAALARASLTAASSAAAKGKWQALFAEGAALEANAAIQMPLLTHVANVGDRRVAPLVQSQWDQEEADGKLCYNRFTPILSTGDHATCGCVATAMAQVMRYYQFPTAAREPVTRTCFINVYQAAAAEDPACITNLTTQAGVYDWSKMPLVPRDGATDAECAAIGKLTSDAGISVNMSYGMDATGSSGTFLFHIPGALTDVFGYANADYYSMDDNVSDDVIARAMLANFNAGCPVIMGISGNNGGHAIVGDGYGYNDETLYVHLNMGWSGQEDFWYNLPDIDSYPSFSVFTDLVFNIFPDDASRAILSGRIVDEETNAVSGATVKVYAAGGATCLAETTTSASGVYGVRVAQGSYDVVVTKVGYPDESLASVSVPATIRRTKAFGGYILYPTWTEWYTGISYVTSIGNTYATDLALSSAAAVIVTNGVEMGFKTLDAAIDAARTISQNPDSQDVVIKIQADLSLMQTATIDFSCTITAAEGVRIMPTITRAKGASIKVASGGVLALKNITFASGATTVVTVAAGGSLHLGDGVDFGVASTIAAVKTADAAGFVLLEGISSGFTLDCAAAKDADGIFGSSLCSVPDIVASVARIANAYDNYGELRGVAEDTLDGTILKWADVSVPLEESVGYFVNAAGQTNTAARIDRLFEKFSRLQADGETSLTNEIVLFDRAALAMDARVTITNTTIILRGATPSVTVAQLGAKAGFDILAGGALLLEDLTFKGFTGETFLNVAGGSLILDDGATLDGLNGTSLYFGPVLLRAGTLTLRAGAVITNGVSAGPGGGITAMGGALALEGGTIANCSALRYGGGVCVYNESATMTLSGDLSFVSNIVYSTSVREDIWLSSLSGNLPTIVAPLLSDASSISLSVGANKAGQVFATTAEDLSAHEANVAARAFFCASPYDSTKSLRGSAENDQILWAEKTAALDEDEREFAVVCLTYADGREAYYDDIVTAFGCAANQDFTATILQDDVSFSEDLVVAGQVTMCSTNTPAFSLARTEDAFVQVASTGALTLTNIHVTVVTPVQSSDEPLVLVQGGALTLEAGASLSGVYKDSTYSENARAASAVAVYSGGTFTMKPSSRIFDCANYSVDELKNVQSGVGGGVLVDGGSTAFLLGGTISNCRASMGGAVYVCNKSTVYVAGAFTATDNLSVMDDALSNVVVEDLSELYLLASLDGSSGIGSSLGYQYLVRDANLVGRVSPSFEGTLAQVADSARVFTNDKTGDFGIAVKPTSGSGEMLIVWSDALDANGEVVVNGTNYVMVAGGERITPTPIAFQSITKMFADDGTVSWQLVVTNRVKYCSYRLLSTDDLAKGFTTTNAWEKSSINGPWTNNVTTTTEKFFWRAEAKGGMNPENEVSILNQKNKEK